MARDRAMIELYSFVSLATYATVVDSFPHAVSCGTSKVLQYAVSDRNSVDLEPDADVIIRAIERGIDKTYNCDHSVASVVSQYFCDTCEEK